MAESINFGIRLRLEDGGKFAVEVDQANAAIKRLTKDAAAGATEAGGAFSSLGSAIGSVGKLAGGALAFAGLKAAVCDFVRMADAANELQSKLRLVTASAQQQAEVYARLLTTANSARVSVTELGNTYAQLARSTADLGISQDRLLGVTKTISQALTISGGSAASTQAAMVQLSQGFASGTLRGEELNSILEQTPRLAQAIAQGLGVSIGQLREMGTAGELTAAKVIGALEKSAGSVAKEFGQVEATVGQSLTVLGNSTLDLVGKFDKATSTSRGLSAAILGIGEALDKIGRTMDNATSGDNWFANLNRRMDERTQALARQQQLGRLEREAANPNTSAARQREVAQELGGLAGAEFASDDARFARMAETRINATNQMRAALDGYINSTDNMSKQDRKVRALAEAWDKFAAATKGVAEGVKGHGRGAGCSCPGRKEHRREVQGPEGEPG
jgi:tape measure domain-containing protein